MSNKKIEFPFYALSTSLAARKDIRASDKIVFSIIRDYIGNNTKCWPGIRTIAKDTGLTTVTVIESIRRLESKNLLKVKRRGNGKSSYYSIPKSAIDTIPVKKLDRLRNYNSTGKETIPEPVKKLTPNQTDLLNQTHGRATKGKTDPGKNGELFDDFWKVWPKKVAKQDARKAWKKLRPSEDLVNEIIAAVELQRQSRQWQRDGGRFIPNPSGWLNGKRWKDEIATSESLLISKPLERDQDGLTPRERFLRDKAC